MASSLQGITDCLAMLVRYRLSHITNGLLMVPNQFVWQGKILWLKGFYQSVQINISWIEYTQVHTYSCVYYQYRLVLIVQAEYLCWINRYPAVGWKSSYISHKNKLPTIQQTPLYPNKKQDPYFGQPGSLYLVA